MINKKYSNGGGLNVKSVNNIKPDSNGNVSVNMTNAQTLNGYTYEQVIENASVISKLIEDVSGLVTIYPTLSVYHKVVTKWGRYVFIDIEIDTNRVITGDTLTTIGTIDSSITPLNNVIALHAIGFNSSVSSSAKASACIVNNNIQLNIDYPSYTVVAISGVYLLP